MVNEDSALRSEKLAKATNYITISIIFIIIKNEERLDSTSFNLAYIIQLETFLYKQTQRRT